MDFDIEYQKLSLYLEKKGYIKAATNRSGIDAYTEGVVGEPLELLVVNNQGASDYQASVENAVSILAEHEGIESHRMLLKIRSIDYDLHHYKVGEHVQNDISVLLLDSILIAAKTSLREASRLEHRIYFDSLAQRQRENVSSPREESEDFLNQCRFAHTWKGSFGITIETPLWIPSVGFSNEVSDTLGRKTSKRILSVLKLVEQAEAHESAQYLVDHLGDYNDLSIVSEFPKILDSIGHEKVSFDVDFSPQIPSTPALEAAPAKVLTRKSLVIIEKAIEQTRVRDEEIETEIIGFPEVLRAGREDLIATNLFEGERRVGVRGVSRVAGNLSIRLTLSLEDYRKALKAQDENKNVLVRCKIKKRLRGWELVELYSFELLPS